MFDFIFGLHLKLYCIEINHITVDLSSFLFPISCAQRHKINVFYTAPTAIRALMKFGEAPVNKYDLSSLRVLGTVGEPINPEV